MSQVLQEVAVLCSPKAPERLNRRSERAPLVALTLLHDILRTHGDMNEMRSRCTSRDASRVCNSNRGNGKRCAVFRNVENQCAARRLQEGSSPAWAVRGVNMVVPHIWYHVGDTRRGTTFLRI